MHDSRRRVEHIHLNPSHVGRICRRRFIILLALRQRGVTGDNPFPVRHHRGCESHYSLMWHIVHSNSNVCERVHRPDDDAARPHSRLSRCHHILSLDGKCI